MYVYCRRSSGLHGMLNEHVKNKHLKTKHFSQGCPNDDCYRKVNRLSSGLYRCDRCERDSGQCRWVYNLRVSSSRILRIARVEKIRI